jgi:HEAT repeat protein
VRGLIVAVACCGVITWAARSVWEGQHPTIAAARGLGSPKPSDRARAARELMATGVGEPGRATPPLIAALGDPEAEVRAVAAEALGAIGGDAARAGSAGDAVGLATAGLIRALKDREPAVRIAAMNALVPIAYGKGSAGGVDVQAVIVAIAGTLGDGDDRVRTAALDALALCGSLGPGDPPSALVAALEDRSDSCRAAAFKALASFPCPLDPWLPLLLRSVEHEEPGVRAACWAAFARARPPAFSPAAIPALVAALGSRVWIVRFSAAKALEPYAGDPRAAVAIPSLEKLLSTPIHPDPGEPGMPPGASSGNVWDPGQMAAELLAKLAPGTTSAGEVVAALTEEIRYGPPYRRYAMIDALAAFGAEAEPAIPALIQVLREDLGSQRGSRFPGGFEAARALGRIAPGTKSADAALAALTEAIQSPSQARLWAILALPAFGEKAAGAIPQLRAWQKGPDYQLKAAATSALKAIEGAQAASRRGGTDESEEGKP